MSIADLRIDHVTSVVEDPLDACEELRAKYGLGSERSGYLDFAGARSWLVPLMPPSYLELLSIEDESAAEGSAVGRQLLQRRATGGGLVAWSVLVDDLARVSERLSIPIFDYTKMDEQGVVRGWRSVTGRPHLPFFIEYGGAEARAQRLRDLYTRVAHRRAPTAFSQLTLSGSEDELLDWLGPHRLPLHLVAGNDGIVEARIATAAGEVILH
jgi:Glyoxalase-like domain